MSETLSLSQPTTGITWVPIRYLMHIFEHKCANCGHTHKSSTLYLICEPSGKYAKSTTRKIEVRRGPVAYPMLERGVSTIRKTTPFCHDCFIPREGTITPQHARAAWRDKPLTSPPTPREMAHEDIDIGSL